MTTTELESFARRKISRERCVWVVSVSYIFVIQVKKFYNAVS